MSDWKNARDARANIIEAEVARIAEQEIDFEARIDAMTQITVVSGNGYGGYCDPHEVARVVGGYIYGELTKDELTVTQTQVEQMRGEHYGRWYGYNHEYKKFNSHVGKLATNVGLSAFNALVGGTRGYHFSLIEQQRQYTQSRRANA